MKTTGPGQAPLLLPDAVQVLAQADRPYAIIGAMALAFHGVIRASLDVDLLLLGEPKPLAPLKEGFRAKGFEAEVRSGDPEDPIPALLRVHDRNGNQLDILAGLRGLDPSTGSRVVEAEHEGERLCFIGLEDLVAMKLFAGAPQDVEDARRLLSIAGDAADRSLLRRLARGYGEPAVMTLETLLRESGFRR